MSPSWIYAILYPTKYSLETSRSYSPSNIHCVLYLYMQRDSGSDVAGEDGCYGEDLGPFPVFGDLVGHIHQLVGKELQHS